MRSRFVAIGLVLVVVVATVLIIRAANGGSYEVTATFDQVNGLVEGADVEAAGIKVGSVKTIDLGDDGLPQVTLKLDDDYRLNTGAKANIRAFSASGEVNRFVSVERGDGEQLPDGGRVAKANTDQPVEIDQLLSTLDEKTRVQVRSALAGFNAATNGRGPDLAKTLEHSGAALNNTADAVRQVAGDGEALRVLVSRGRQIVSTLAEDPAALGRTADELSAVLGRTASHERELAEAAGALPGGIGSPRRALDRLDGSIGNLRRLVADARPGVRALIPFSKALRPALHQARPALRDAAGLIQAAPAQLQELRPLLTTADGTLALANPALREAGPVLDEVRVRTPDFFSFFANWADFTGSYDANGHAARVGLVLAPGATNAIGPSDSGPGSMRTPFVRDPGVLEGEPWLDYKDSYIGSGF